MSYIAVMLTVDGAEHLAETEPHTLERLKKNLAPQGTPNAITAIRRATADDIAEYERAVRARRNPARDLRRPGQGA